MRKKSWHEIDRENGGKTERIGNVPTSKPVRNRKDAGGRINSRIILIQAIEENKRRN
jgi:hypothetical protein